MPKPKFSQSQARELFEKNDAIYLENPTIFGVKTKLLFQCKCGSQHRRSIESVLKNGSALCIQCSKQAQMKKSKATTLKNHGHESIFQSDAFKIKIKKIMNERYGVDYPSQSQEIRHTMIQNNFEKQNMPHPSQTPEVIEKMKQTCLQKYGVSNAMHSKDIKNKLAEVNVEKQGVACVLQSSVIKEKCEQTNIKKQGSKNVFGSKEIQEKILATNLAKQGVPNPTQNVDIFEKSQKFRFKDFVMPSGIVRRVQGYEPFALKELLQIQSEEEIITKRSDIPKIVYKCKDQEKIHFPDIQIPNKNLLIEVKSDQTFRADYEKNKSKQIAAIALGYAYEFFCQNSKGSKIPEETLLNFDDS